MRAQESALGVLGFTLNERKSEVAAEDDAAGAGDAVGEARRDRADAGDRHDAERDAGDEDAEAAQAAAQFAPGKAQREVQRGDLFGIAAGASIMRAFGMTRASRKCAGANAKSGNPTIRPASQT